MAKNGRYVAQKVAGKSLNCGSVARSLRITRLHHNFMAAQTAAVLHSILASAHRKVLYFKAQSQG